MKYSINDLYDVPANGSATHVVSFDADSNLQAVDKYIATPFGSDWGGTRSLRDESGKTIACASFATNFDKMAKTVRRAH
jgi:hypothetical protein